MKRQLTGTIALLLIGSLHGPPTARAQSGFPANARIPVYFHFDHDDSECTYGLEDPCQAPQANDSHALALNGRCDTQTDFYNWPSGITLTDYTDCCTIKNPPNATDPPVGGTDPPADFFVDWSSHPGRWRPAPPHYGPNSPTADPYQPYHWNYTFGLTVLDALNRLPVNRRFYWHASTSNPPAPGANTFLIEAIADPNPSNCSPGWGGGGTYTAHLGIEVQRGTGNPHCGYPRARGARLASEWPASRMDVAVNDGATDEAWSDDFDWYHVPFEGYSQHEVLHNVGFSDADMVNQCSQGDGWSGGADQQVVSIGDAQRMYDQDPNAMSHDEYQLMCWQTTGTAGFSTSDWTIVGCPFGLSDEATYTQPSVNLGPELAFGQTEGTFTCDAPAGCDTFLVGWLKAVPGERNAETAAVPAIAWVAVNAGGGYVLLFESVLTGVRALNRIGFVYSGPRRGAGGTYGLYWVEPGPPNDLRPGEFDYFTAEDSAETRQRRRLRYVTGASPALVAIAALLQLGRDATSVAFNDAVCDGNLSPETDGIRVWVPIDVAGCRGATCPGSSTHAFVAHGLDQTWPGIDERILAGDDELYPAVWSHALQDTTDPVGYTFALDRAQAESLYSAGAIVTRGIAMSLEGQNADSLDQGLLVYLSPHRDGTLGGGSVLALSPRSGTSIFLPGAQTYCDTLWPSYPVDGQQPGWTNYYGVGIALTSYHSAGVGQQRYLAAVTRQRLFGSLAAAGYSVRFVRYTIDDAVAPGQDTISQADLGYEFYPSVVPVDLERLPLAGKYFMVGARFPSNTSW